MLQRSFYQQNSIQLAQRLIGCELVHSHPKGTTAGIIIEAEAYRQDDPASHSFKGKTRRNEVMFGEVGHAYIYFTYGMHYCFNVVAGDGSMAEAVLVRALEPTQGVELMKQRRRTTDALNLCSGPAKLVEAMGIVPLQNGADLTEGNLYLKDKPIKGREMMSSPRIGITRATDRPWRFFVHKSPYVTRHKFNALGQLV